MNNQEFHKPFLKSMIIIAFTTIIAMTTSKYVVKYYMEHRQRDIINTSFETKQPQNSSESSQ